MVVSIVKHDPVDGWRFLQVPGNLLLPSESLSIIDYEFYTYEYLLILAYSKDLDAVYIVKVCINDWTWNECNMNEIQQGDILHSFESSSKPDHFIVNYITQSITVYSARDISIYCL